MHALKKATLVVVASLVVLALVGWAYNQVKIGGVSITSEDTNITFYVNASTGSDFNDGLDDARPLETIQEAVDRLPRFIATAYTIKLASGTYEEEVEFIGITTTGDGSLLVLGDESTPITIPSNVIIDGGDSGGSNDYGIFIENTSKLEIEGVKIVDFEITGIGIFHYSNVWLEHVEITDDYDEDGRGIICSRHSEVYIQGNVSCIDTSDGLAVMRNSYARIKNGTDSNRNQFNGNTRGILVLHESTLTVPFGNVYLEANNNQHGILSQFDSLVFINNPSGDIDINDNCGYGIVAIQGAKAFGCSYADYSGNGAGDYYPTTLSSVGSIAK